MGLKSVITKKIWECDVCNKESKWDESTWSHRTILNRRTLHDEQIIACSDECRDKFDKSRFRPRKKKAT